MGATKIPTMLEKKTMISQMNASRISRAGIGRAKEQRACCADYRRAKYFIQKVQERQYTSEFNINLNNEQ